MQKASSSIAAVHTSVPARFSSTVPWIETRRASGGSQSDLRLGRARQHQQRPCKGGRGETAVNNNRPETVHGRMPGRRKPLLLSRLEILNCADVRITWIESSYNAVSPCDRKSITGCLYSEVFRASSFYFCSSWVCRHRRRSGPARHRHPIAAPDLC